MNYGLINKFILLEAEIILCMDMEEKSDYNQQDIDIVWSDVWKKQSNISPKVLFGNRLFAEGYTQYKKYLPEKSFSLLEIGAGSGRYGLAIARDHKDSSIILTDPVQSSVDAMRYTHSKLEYSNITLAKEDATALSYPDDTFDVVLADGVIQHIIDYDTAMYEMIRVLKPGGRLIISAVNSKNPPHMLYKFSLKLLGKEYEYGYERTYRRKELVKLFTDHGLEMYSQDGFYLAYGMFRWGYKIKIFKFLSKILNRIIKICDALFNRAFSRRGGFMIFCVGVKAEITNN